MECKLKLAYLSLIFKAYSKLHFAARNNYKLQDAARNNYKHYINSIYRF